MGSHYDSSSLAAVVAVTFAAEAEADAAFDASVLDSLPGMGAAPPVLGSNVDGGSIFTNYINARQDGQFFLRSKHLLQYETPASPAVREVYFLAWCGLLEFSDRGGVNQTTTTTTGVGVGYTAQCVGAGLDDAISEVVAQGADAVHPLTADQFVVPISLSAVYVPQTNVFEGQYHSVQADFVYRFWDDGRATMSSLVWEPNEEKDPEQGSVLSSFSGVVEFDWVTVEEAASILLCTTLEFTTQNFQAIYEKVWLLNAPQAAAIERRATETATAPTETTLLTMMATILTTFAFAGMSLTLI